MINLTDVQLADLQRRGTNYLRVLGVEWDNQSEALSRAFLQLCEILENHTEDKHLEISNNVWKKLCKQGAVSDYRQRARSRIPRDLYDGQSPDTAELYQESHDEFAIISEAYDVLNDDDMIVVLALAENDLSVTKTAEYIGETRTNCYNVISKIRSKMKRRMPEYFNSKVNTGSPSAKLAKYSGWNTFFNVVEVVVYDENSLSLRDESEIDRLLDKPVVYRNRAAFGSVPGTTPLVQSMTLKEYEGGM